MQQIWLSVPCSSLSQEAIHKIKMLSQTNEETLYTLVLGWVLKQVTFTWGLFPESKCTKMPWWHGVLIPASQLILKRLLPS